MTEIYKVLNNLSPPIMNDIFQKQENYYPLRNPRSPVSKGNLLLLTTSILSLSEDLKFGTIFLKTLKILTH